MSRRSQRKRRRIAIEDDCDQDLDILQQSMDQIDKKAPHIPEIDANDESSALMITMLLLGVKQTSKILHRRLLREYLHRINLRESGRDSDSDSDLWLTESESFKRRFAHDGYRFTEEHVLMLRNKKSEERLERVDGRAEISISHYVEIAIKSKNPHPKYNENMHRLLKDYVDEIRGIATMIISYTHNGCIWYEMKLSEPDDDYRDAKNYSDLNDDIISRLAFHPDDYFRHLGHYHIRDSKDIIGHDDNVTFETFRSTLGLKKLQEMSDEQIAMFLQNLCELIFGIVDFDMFEIDRAGMFRNSLKS